MPAELATPEPLAEYGPKTGEVDDTNFTMASVMPAPFSPATVNLTGVLGAYPPATSVMVPPGVSDPEAVTPAVGPEGV